jgi:hypothetical protein
VFSNGFQEEHEAILATTMSQRTSTYEEEVEDSDETEIAADNDETMTEADSDADYVDELASQEPDQRGNGKQMFQIPVADFS